MTFEEKILEINPIIINGTAYITDLSFKKSISEVFAYFEQQKISLYIYIKELEIKNETLSKELEK